MQKKAKIDKQGFRLTICFQKFNIATKFINVINLYKKINQFAQEVFTKPEIVDSFNKYKEVYQQERDIQLSDNFEVSSQALKKKGTGTMTTIKLDKNFDINIHSGEQYIERGFDKERNMYYYQLFFKEEK